MLSALSALVATLLHAALVFAASPLLAGTIATLRARCLGRRGPPPWQPYLNLLRRLRKSTLIPDTATDLFPLWPYVCLAAYATAALLVPSFCTGLLTAPFSDVISLIGLFALGRAATICAGLESGASFGGAGAARDALFSIFAEAALLVTILSFVLITKTFAVDGISVALRTSHIGLSVSLGFAFAAMLAVALTESGRLPADNPSGHLELAMVHEAMLLTYSGKLLALLEYAAMLRLLVWFNLISAIFCPFYMANAAAPLTWPLALLLWLIKLSALTAALTIYEITTAKMRVFRVPEFLGVAMLLGVLAGIFLFVASRFAA
jgi:formate hydrogenlyase subunit 4